MVFRRSKLETLFGALIFVQLSPLEADISGGRSLSSGRGRAECWTNGFTWEQCCNKLFGERGNSVCWDADSFNAEYCCLGEFFEAADCKEFVATFDFSIIQLIPDAWERCVTAMQYDANRCNSAKTSPELCPECAALSPHAAKYIGCVKSEQIAVSRADGGGAGVAYHASVGGMHYPTVFIPRSDGRDFAAVAPAFDSYVGNRLIVDGQWMNHEVQRLVGLTRVDDIIVDAGANIGGFTLPLAKHVGLGGQIHAFEPFRLNFQCLNANVMFNGLSNVHTYQVGLGNQTNIVKRAQPNLNTIMNPSKMHVAAQVASELMVRHDTKLLEPVRVEPLDNYFAGDGVGLIGHQRRGPSFIKIDVESMELSLVQGAVKTLRRFRPSLYIEDSEQMGPNGEPTRLMQFMYEQDFLWIDLVEAGFRDATSLLFVPRERRKEMMERLYTISWKGGT